MTFYNDRIADEDEAYSFDRDHPFQLEPRQVINDSFLPFEIAINLTLQLSYCHKRRTCRMLWNEPGRRYDILYTGNSLT